MRLNEEYLEKIEELFEMIPNSEDVIELDLAMDRMRVFLENDVDGWTHHSDEELSLGVLSQLEEIAELVRANEKDPGLDDLIEDVLADIEADANRVNLEEEINNFYDEDEDGSYSEAEQEEGEEDA